MLAQILIKPLSDDIFLPVHNFYLKQSTCGAATKAGVLVNFLITGTQYPHLQLKGDLFWLMFLVHSWPAPRQG